MNINREKSPCTNYEGRVGFRECVAKSFMKTSNCKVNTGGVNIDRSKLS